MKSLPPQFRGFIQNSSKLHIHILWFKASQFRNPLTELDKQKQIHFLCVPCLELTLHVCSSCWLYTWTTGMSEFTYLYTNPYCRLNLLPGKIQGQNQMYNCPFIHCTWNESCSNICKGHSNTQSGHAPSTLLMCNTNVCTRPESVHISNVF